MRDGIGVSDISPKHPGAVSWDVLKGQFVTEHQEGDPYAVDDQDYEGAEKHPLLIWTSLSPGDVVSLQVIGGQDCVGTVESKTSTGLIIWIRDDLNERRLFHFRECQSVARR